MEIGAWRPRHPRSPSDPVGDFLRPTAEENPHPGAQKNFPLCFSFEKNICEKQNSLRRSPCLSFPDWHHISLPFWNRLDEIQLDSFCKRSVAITGPWLERGESTFPFFLVLFFTRTSSSLDAGALPWLGRIRLLFSSSPELQESRYACPRLMSRLWSRPHQFWFSLSIRCHDDHHMCKERPFIWRPL